MSDILEWAAKYAVVQSALAALVLIWGWQWIIKRGEKDQPSSDLQARWQAQQDLHDISENVKTLVAYQKEIKDVLNRLTDVIWNRERQ